MLHLWMIIFLCSLSPWLAPIIIIVSQHARGIRRGIKKSPLASGFSPIPRGALWKKAAVRIRLLLGDISLGAFAFTTGLESSRCCLWPALCTPGSLCICDITRLSRIICIYILETSEAFCSCHHRGGLGKVRSLRLERCIDILWIGGLFSTVKLSF